MAITDQVADRLARRILAVADAAASMPPITEEAVDFDLHDAYRVAARVTELRTTRGERVVGWKIGFTNRTIWDEYGVHAPIWGPLYDSTVQRLGQEDRPARCPIRNLVEPRIEPEVVFRIATPPHPDMDEQELLSSIDAVGHGFEIVQSLFPGWRFQAADTVAAFALHGRYCCGPLSAIEAVDRSEWLARLADFEIVLSCNGTEIDRGVSANVLGGPLSALRHFVRGLAETPLCGAIRSGDLVTTGTITRAFPVQPGERWSTEVVGLPLPGLDLLFE
jgi:2-oxo-3-hexenedioate decarboxylase